jgi:hypothetical protein
MRYTFLILILFGSFTACGASSAMNATAAAAHHYPFTLGSWPHAIGPYANFTTVDGPYDAAGVRVVILNGIPYQHPVAQAQNALSSLVLYSSSHDAADLIRAIKDADRLIADHVTNAATGDAWWYPYTFDSVEYENPEVSAIAPWYSGMAQGEALDLFAQLYHVTGDPTWQVAAAHTFAAFLYPLKPGEAVLARPWVVQTDTTDHLWIEEYPTPNPNDDVINGFGFALYGLIDYFQIMHDSRAFGLIEAGLTTYLYGVGLVRHPGGISGYCVSHPADTIANYHIIVTEQLANFAKLTGNAKFATMERLYYQDYH